MTTTQTTDPRRRVGARDSTGDVEGGDLHRTGTRAAIRDLLLERGALTATEIGRELGVTAAAVRRHLDALQRQGCIAPDRRRPAGTRGRPATAFQLTRTGRSTAQHGYDRLAQDAIAELHRVGGGEAVAAFARSRVRSLLGHIRPATGPDDLSRVADDIAEALSDAGYAASVEDAGGGLQICQHHCPVWSVASRFPELCEAEQQVVSELVGSHVQRLATIAGGDCACTTNIPDPTVSADVLAATIPRQPPDGRPPTGVDPTRPTGVYASEDNAERTQR